MRKIIEDEELKATILNILSDVADFCTRKQIRYYLVCGTALGAVRHNGFIPWDDDIDIGIPRPDYERFLAEYQSAKYYLCSSKKDPNYPYPFAKVCDPRTELIEKIAHPYKLGVYIDVFPIDGLPSNPQKLKKHLKKIAWDQRLLTWKRLDNNRKEKTKYKILHGFAKLFLAFIPISFLVRKVDKHLSVYPYDSSENVGHLVTKAYWGQDVKPRHIFEKPVPHKFEDRVFLLPGDYDMYLRLEYGDYMTLPPKEKQVSNHDFSAYWIE